MPTSVPKHQTETLTVTSNLKLPKDAVLKPAATLASAAFLGVFLLSLGIYLVLLWNSSPGAVITIRAMLLSAIVAGAVSSPVFAWLYWKFRNDYVASTPNRQRHKSTEFVTVASDPVKQAPPVRPSTTTRHSATRTQIQLGRFKFTPDQLRLLRNALWDTRLLSQANLKQAGIISNRNANGGADIAHNIQQDFLEKGWVTQHGNTYKLTDEGWTAIGGKDE